MAKKKETEMTADELREELRLSREKSDTMQKDQERKDQEREDARKREDRVKADAEAAKTTEISEETWLKLEDEYGMDRKAIGAAWKIANRANAPLVAQLNSYKAKEAAGEAILAAKNKVREEDPQFPKYERLVDEYMADVPLAEKADPERMAKHMDRAVHFAKGKARATDKSYREEELDSTREAGASKEELEDAKDHFGSFSFSGMPLTIDNQKLVPDDFRKRHAHPEIKGAVRMDEKARWKDGVPVKPR